MKTLIVYESMYGNTHVIADHIAEAARRVGDVQIVAVSHASAGVVAGADLVIVGGPTHVHGMTRASTRTSAIEQPKHDEHIDPDAEGPGLREWFDALGRVDGIAAAAFDTRMHGPAALTGRASKGIGKSLRQHGFREVVDGESFLVDKENHLCDGEADRARVWGESVMAQVGSTTR